MTPSHSPNAPRPGERKIEWACRIGLVKWRPDGKLPTPGQIGLHVMIDIDRAYWAARKGTA